MFNRGNTTVYLPRSGQQPWLPYLRVHPIWWSQVSVVPWGHYTLHAVFWPTTLVRGTPRRFCVMSRSFCGTPRSFCGMQRRLGGIPSNLCKIQRSLLTLRCLCFTLPQVGPIAPCGTRVTWTKDLMLNQLLNPTGAR